MKDIIVSFVKWVIKCSIYQYILNIDWNRLNKFSVPFQLYWTPDVNNACCCVDFCVYKPKMCWSPDGCLLKWRQLEDFFHFDAYKPSIWSCSRNICDRACLYLRVLLVVGFIVLATGTQKYKQAVVGWCHSCCLESDTLVNVMISLSPAHLDWSAVPV